MAVLLDLIIIAGFFVLMLAIGIYHYTMHVSEGGYNYFVASGTLGPFVSAMTYMATLFSMFTFLGAVGLFSAIGLSFTNLLFGETYMVAVLMPTLGWKFYRMSHAKESMTPSDIIADRFGDSDLVRVVLALALVGSMLIYLTVQYIGVGIVLSIVTDNVLTFNTVVVLMLLVGGIYVAIGGMQSVATTDFIQGILLTLGLLILLGALFTTFDPGQMAQTGLDAKPALGGISGTIGSTPWLSWVAEMFAFGMGMFLWPQLWVRTYATNSRRGLITMSAAMMIANLLLIGTVGYFMALGAPLSLQGVENADQIAVLFSEQYLPGWLSALVLTGGAAAALSSLDSVALVLGSILSHDLYDKVLRSGDEISESHKSWANRICAFAVMLIGAALVFSAQGLIAGLLVTFGYPAVAGVFPAVVLGMYWKKASTNAASVSMIVAVLLVLGQQVFHVVPTLGIYSGGWAFVVGLVLMVGISLVESREADSEQVDTYVLR